MKVYAMSDIHGCLNAFEKALFKVDLSGDNKLLLLGDYIHGPHDYEVMDRIISLQEKYGHDKVVALRGNHEEMALDGTWNINENRYGVRVDPAERDERKYLSWMRKLPYYHTVGNTIFVHAGIDEEAAEAGYWEWGTGEHIFTSQFPAQTGKIPNFDMKIVAGHVGTYAVSHNPYFHDIYHDGGSHYYIDGTVHISGAIPVLMYDTDRDMYYRVTESGPWLILPYDEEH